MPKRQKRRTGLRDTTQAGRVDRQHATWSSGAVAGGQQNLGRAQTLVLGM